MTDIIDTSSGGSAFVPPAAERKQLDEEGIATNVSSVAESSNLLKSSSSKLAGSVTGPRSYGEEVLETDKARRKLVDSAVDDVEDLSLVSELAESEVDFSAERFEETLDAVYSNTFEVGEGEAVEIGEMMAELAEIMEDEFEEIIGEVKLKEKGRLEEGSITSGLKERQIQEIAERFADKALELVFAESIPESKRTEFRPVLVKKIKQELELELGRRRLQLDAQKKHAKRGAGLDAKKTHESRQGIAMAGVKGVVGTVAFALQSNAASTMFPLSPAVGAVVSPIKVPFAVRIYKKASQHLSEAHQARDQMAAQVTELKKSGELSATESETLDELLQVQDDVIKYYEAQVDSAKVNIMNAVSSGTLSMGLGATQLGAFLTGATWTTTAVGAGVLAGATWGLGLLIPAVFISYTIAKNPEKAKGKVSNNARKVAKRWNNHQYKQMEKRLGKTEVKLLGNVMPEELPDFARMLEGEISDVDFKDQVGKFYEAMEKLGTRWHDLCEQSGVPAVALLADADVSVGQMDEDRRFKLYGEMSFRLQRGINRLSAQLRITRHEMRKISAAQPGLAELKNLEKSIDELQERLMSRLKSSERKSKRFLRRESTIMDMEEELADWKARRDSRSNRTRRKARREVRSLTSEISERDLRLVSLRKRIEEVDSEIAELIGKIEAKSMEITKKREKIAKKGVIEEGVEDQIAALENREALIFDEINRLCSLDPELFRTLRALHRGHKFLERGATLGARDRKKQTHESWKQRIKDARLMRAAGMDQKSFRDLVSRTAAIAKERPEIAHAMGISDAEMKDPTLLYNAIRLYLLPTIEVKPEDAVESEDGEGAGAGELELREAEEEI